jgi:fibronectin-binding autotransporter adhesin
MKNDLVKVQSALVKGSRNRLLAWLAVAIAAVALPVWAADRTWTGGGSGGNWSDANNWGGTAPGNGDNLTFPAGASRKANTNNTLTSVGSVTIGEGGYSIKGNALTLGSSFGSTGDSTWDIDLTLSSSRTIESYAGMSGGTLTISGDIALGSAGAVVLNANHTTGNDGNITVSGTITGTGTGVVLTKDGSGAGTVTLSGSNSYAGKTAINSGFLQVSSDGNLGTAPSSTTTDKIQFGGGFLRATSSFTLNAKRGTKIVGGGLTTGFWVDDGATLTYGGVTIGAGATTQYKLTLDGEGTIVLSGNSTYRGNAIVVIAVARISHASALGSSASGGIVEVNALSTVEVTGGITVTKGILLDYAVLESVSGNNAWSGFVEIGINTSGKSVIRSSESGSTLTMSGDVVIDTDYDTGNVFENLCIEGEGDIDVSGTISGDGTDGEDGYILGHADVIMDGTGTLTLSGVNTYSGRLLLNDGTTVVTLDDSFGAVPDAASEGRIVFNGGALTAAGDFTVNEYRGVAIYPDGSGTAPFGVEDGYTVEYAGIIADYASGVGNLTKRGLGALLLSGENTYKGKTSIEAGTLGAATIKDVGSSTASSLGKPATAANGAIAMSTDAGDPAVLLYNGTGDTTDREIVLAGTGDATITQNGSGLLTLTTDVLVSYDAAHTLTLNGSGVGEVAAVIPNADSESTALVKDGDGTWRFSANQTYSGSTTISGGTLQLGTGGTAGSINPDSTLENNGTLVFDQSDTVDQGTDFNGTISGTGTVEQNGSGTTILDEANTYEGGTTVNDGTLLVNNTTGSGTGSGAATVNSAATLGGNGTVGGAVTVKSGGRVEPGPASSTIGTLTFDSDVTFESGSTYEVGIGSGTSCDKLDLKRTGALTLGAGVSVLEIGTVTGDGRTIAINIKRDGIAGEFDDTDGNLLEHDSTLHLAPNTTYCIHYVDMTDTDDGFIVLDQKPNAAEGLIRAYATPIGVVVEFQTTEEAGQNDILLYLYRDGHWVEVGRQPAAGEGSHTYRFEVAGLNAGDIVNLCVRDDEGNTHTVNDLEVSSFANVAVRIVQAGSSGLTLQWESIPGRTYDIYRTQQLGGEWEHIRTVEAVLPQTETVVTFESSRSAAFFRIGVR